MRKSFPFRNRNYKESKMRKLTSMITISVAMVFFVSGCDQQSGASKQDAKPAQAVRQSPAPQPVVDVQETVAKVQAALNSKNYGQAVETAHTAVAADPKNTKALFVLAEAQGASGDVFGALKSLDDALKNGYDNKNAIYASEYLGKVRATSGFNELMSKYGMTRAKTAKKTSKGTSYKSEDSIRAGDVKINMKEVFKDDN